ncbi:MAG: hypoxanthine phosphoribosyltransferase [Oligosphaeraceae bacterium]|nr:hypoxanthine phosphoribosyltransferase [Oligosphaeraceae bacterium]
MEILCSTAAVQQRVQELGREITEFYRDKPLTLLALLNGAMFFATDLARAIDLEMHIDSIAVSSYAGQQSSGRIALRGDCKLPVTGRHLLLVDGVLDTGLTLTTVADLLRARGALSVRTCVLAEKIHPRPVGMHPADWCGFKLPDRFLVGCGMDAAERYRQLPYIAALD